VSRIRHEDEVTAISVGISDTLLATGSGPVISFHDIRMVASNGNNNSSLPNETKKLGEYADVHTDAVTQLRFSKANPSILASGSEDGLICVYDTASSGADSAVLSIFNTECPVRRIGFFGGSEEALYCLSSVETASFWHIPSAQRVGHFSTVREALGVDYLVDCMYDAECDALMMVAGDYSGRGLLAIVEPTQIQPFAVFGNSAGAAAATAAASSSSAAAGATGNRSGHSAMLRCAAKLNATGGDVITLPNGSRVNSARFLTGGEDACICSWRLGNPPALPSASSHANGFAGLAGGGGGSHGASAAGGLVHQNKRQERRDRPY
jgi:hypothetical protein